MVVRIDAYYPKLAGGLAVLMYEGRLTGIHLSAPSLEVLSGVHAVGVQDTSELDLWLNGSILLERGQ